MDDSQMDLSQQFLDAYDLLENSKQNIFITGQAGTGKSTLLQYFRGHTTKNMVILAPTGVAAVNVSGQTIHSFFHFKPDITPETVYRVRLRKEDKEIFSNLETIVVDEISMVRADLLDCVNVFLRMHGPKKKEVFGGVQMIFIGDLYQLPPVVTREERYIFRDIYASPYFFSAKIFENLSMEFIDLEKIYRQKDDVFIDLLSAIRNRTVTEKHLQLLNNRVDPYFEPQEQEFYVYLTTTNALADKINEAKLRKVKAPAFSFEGTVDGKFEKKTLPTKQSLELKVGAQVMLLNNDPEGRWINGSIGQIVDIDDDLTRTKIIGVELESGYRVEVLPHKWEMFRFYFNEDTQNIEAQTVGLFMQYPLKLAWAVTIHKSQGKTFSKVILDIGEGTFAHGQTYVALSRCTHLEGVVLRRPIYKKHILLDPRVVHFMKNYQQQDPYYEHQYSPDIL